MDKQVYWSKVTIGLMLIAIASFVLSAAVAPALGI